VTKASALKVILSTIPVEIADRTKFLNIIRDMAALIKELLEAIAAAFTSNESLLASQMDQLELQKKVFVRVSKNFSETLKKYFKDGRFDRACVLVLTKNGAHNHMLALQQGPRADERTPPHQPDQPYPQDGAAGHLVVARSFLDGDVLFCLYFFLLFLSFPSAARSLFSQTQSPSRHNIFYCRHSCGCGCGC
jgi:hypothetical protein